MDMDIHTIAASAVEAEDAQASTYDPLAAERFATAAVYGVHMQMLRDTVTKLTSICNEHSRNGMEYQQVANASQLASLNRELEDVKAIVSVFLEELQRQEKLIAALQETVLDKDAKLRQFEEAFDSSQFEDRTTIAARIQNVRAPLDEKIEQLTASLEEANERVAHEEQRNAQLVTQLAQVQAENHATLERMREARSRMKRKDKAAHGLLQEMSRAQQAAPLVGINVLEAAGRGFVLDIHASRSDDTAVTPLAVLGTSSVAVAADRSALTNGTDGGADDDSSEEDDDGRDITAFRYAPLVLTPDGSLPPIPDSHQTVVAVAATGKHIRTLQRHFGPSLVHHTNRVLSDCVTAVAAATHGYVFGSREPRYKAGYPGVPPPSLGHILVFSNPESALRFCLALHVKLMDVNTPWNANMYRLRPFSLRSSRMAPENLLWRGLRVGIGVAFGPVDSYLDVVTGCLRYSGPTVDRAVELSSVSPAGAILCSSEVSDSTFHGLDKLAGAVVLSNYGYTTLPVALGGNATLAKTNINKKLFLTEVDAAAVAANPPKNKELQTRNQLTSVHLVLPDVLADRVADFPERLRSVNNYALHQNMPKESSVPVVPADSSQTNDAATAEELDKYDDDIDPEEEIHYVDDGGAVTPRIGWAMDCLEEQPTGEVAVVFLSLYEAERLSHSVFAWNTEVLPAYRELVLQKSELLESGGREIFAVKDRIGLVFVDVEQAVYWVMSLQRLMNRSTWPAQVLQDDCAKQAFWNGAQVYSGPRLQAAIHLIYAQPTLEIFSSDVVYEQTDAFSAVSALAGSAKGGETVISSAALTPLLESSTLADDIAIRSLGKVLPPKRWSLASSQFAETTAQQRDPRIASAGEPFVAYQLVPLSLLGRVYLWRGFKDSAETRNSVQFKNFCRELEEERDHKRLKAQMRRTEAEDTLKQLVKNEGLCVSQPESRRNSATEVHVHVPHAEEASGSLFFVPTDVSIGGATLAGGIVSKTMYNCLMKQGLSDAILAMELAMMESEDVDAGGESTIRVRGRSRTVKTSETEVNRPRAGAASGISMRVTFQDLLHLAAAAINEGRQLGRPESEEAFEGLDTHVQSLAAQRFLASVDDAVHRARGKGILARGAASALLPVGVNESPPDDVVSALNLLAESNARLLLTNRALFVMHRIVRVFAEALKAFAQFVEESDGNADPLAALTGHPSVGSMGITFEDITTRLIRIFIMDRTWYTSNPSSAGPAARVPPPIPAQKCFAELASLVTGAIPESKEEFTKIPPDRLFSSAVGHVGRSLQAINSIVKVIRKSYTTIGKQKKDLVKSSVASKMMQAVSKITAARPAKSAISDTKSPRPESLSAPQSVGDMSPQSDTADEQSGTVESIVLPPIASPAKSDPHLSPE